ncbi:hypothetical protein EMIHUDRAFT_243563 [Emiliania huxleyi CCMP1516]|uniref:KOW domain-containing protein n=2 Tax=Emiliania huxleyi TaxID=2903 RepID=A0A0D3J592_EMIH1|nr:hypothetical protein EMIHUDRAFT_243563 [Emiliania huxleyi CCMP1516]EOD18677.1 hypothetical protein EMIHUDRAFT_243563 [Emiliania huxleyi CCMP1516]|eukprot:XP_005771106.1 hypothetical protein EMIHUDRAFT_243563 [Emiliania huxleyi CCMP1516]
MDPSKIDLAAAARAAVARLKERDGGTGDSSAYTAAAARLAALQEAAPSQRPAALIARLDLSTLCCPPVQLQQYGALQHVSQMQDVYLQTAGASHLQTAGGSHLPAAGPPLSMPLPGFAAAAYPGLQPVPEKQRPTVPNVRFARSLIGAALGDDNRKKRAREASEEEASANAAALRDKAKAKAVAAAAAITTPISAEEIAAAQQRLRAQALSRTIEARIPPEHRGMRVKVLGGAAEGGGGTAVVVAARDPESLQLKLDSSKQVISAREADLLPTEPEAGCLIMVVEGAQAGQVGVVESVSLAERTANVRLPEGSLNCSLLDITQWARG